MARLAFGFAVTAALGLAGCGFFGVAGGSEIAEAHVVWRMDPACDAVIVQSTGDGFGVIRPPADLALRRGDVLRGSLRGGITLPLAFYPFPESVAAGSYRFSVHGADLPLGEAQARWRAVCFAD